MILSFVTYFTVSLYAFKGFGGVGNAADVYRYEVDGTDQAAFARATFPGGLRSYDYNKVPQKAREFRIYNSGFSSCP